MISNISLNINLEFEMYPLAMQRNMNKKEVRKRRSFIQRRQYIDIAVNGRHHALIILRQCDKWKQSTDKSVFLWVYGLSCYTVDV